MSTLKQLPVWIFLAGVFLFPLTFLPFTQEFFLTNKAYMLVIVNCLLLLSVAVSLVATKTIYTVKSSFTKLLILLLIAHAVSLFFASTNKIQALLVIPSGLLPIATLTLLYLTGTYIYASTKKSVPIMQTLAGAGFVAALVSIIFYFQPFQAITLDPTWRFLKNPAFSVIGNVLDTLVFYGFLLTGSIAILVSHLRSTSKKAASASPFIAYSLVILVAIGVIAGRMFFGSATDRLAVPILPPVAESWSAALETLKKPQSAFIGVGVDNFDTLFTQIKTPQYNNTNLWQTNFTLSRSAILHIWTETGLFGFVIFLLLMVYVIRELHGLWLQKNPLAILYTCLGMYLLLAFAVLPLSFIAMFLLYSYLFALTLTVAEQEPHAFKTFHVKDIPLVYIALALGCIMIAGGIGYFSLQTYRAEHYFKKSIDAINLNQGQSVYQNLQTAIRINPYIERYRNQFSQVNLILANNLAKKEDLSETERSAVAQFVQQAIAEAKALVALNPSRASNWNTLAVIYRSITNVAEGADAWTVAAYQESIRRDPNNPIFRLNLGGVYYSQQQFDQAALNFEQAVMLKQNWANAHYNYAWALYQQNKFQEAVIVMQNVLILIDENSEDYKLAEENLKIFQEALSKAQAAADAGAGGNADGSAQFPDAQASAESNLTVDEPQNPVDQQPLVLPASPEAQLSPALQLPDSAGPSR